MNDDEARRKMADILRTFDIRGVTRAQVAEALLPVVREIAAEELRETADFIPCSDSELEAKAMLHDRADALTKPPDGPVR